MSWVSVGMNQPLASRIMHCSPGCRCHWEMPTPCITVCRPGAQNATSTACTKADGADHCGASLPRNAPGQLPNDVDIRMQVRCDEHNTRACLAEVVYQDNHELRVCRRAYPAQNHELRQ
eukprot:scpid64300/ scgid30810/ 